MYNAANQQVSYNDFVNASKQNQPIPVVNQLNSMKMVNLAMAQMTGVKMAGLTEKTTIILLYIIHIVHFTSFNQYSCKLD